MKAQRRYEYRIIKGDRTGKYSAEPALDKIELELTGLGLEGWRLVRMHQYTSMAGIPELMFVLERPLPEDPELP